MYLYTIIPNHMNLQKLLSKVRQSVDDYNMIDDGDHIAIGISGGKDSLALLYALEHLRRFYNKRFELEAITVDLGLEGLNTEYIKNVCESLNVKYTIVKTQIAEIIFEARKESNPCSLCAKMRKGALNEEIIKHGCNKVAYAHHKDDVVETLFMSMMYEGRMQTFSPITHLDKTNLTVIRPMIYVNEVDIKGFINKMNLTPCKKICPADGNTKREYVKGLIRQINLDNPGVKERLFKAVLNSQIEGW